MKKGSDRFRHFLLMCIPPGFSRKMDSARECFYLSFLFSGLLGRVREFPDQLGNLLIPFANTFGLLFQQK